MTIPQGWGTKALIIKDIDSLNKYLTIFNLRGGKTPRIYVILQAF